MGRGLTFDTGALIALERRRKRIREVLAAARSLRVCITVPTVVVAEWWRGQTGPVARILEGVVIETLNERIARIAGEAIAAVPKAGSIDAIVMASAAQRGDVVYTSDVADLTRLAERFPGVRVLSV